MHWHIELLSRERLLRVRLDRLHGILLASCVAQESCEVRSVTGSSRRELLLGSLDSGLLLLLLPLLESCQQRLESRSIQ